MNALIVLATSLIAGFVGTRADYPLQDGVSYSNTTDLDGLCIVTPVRRLDPSSRPSLVKGRAPVPVNTDVVTVLASPYLAKGSVAHLSTPWDPKTDGNPARKPLFPLLPGRRYLVIATTPRSGKLTIPNDRGGGIIDENPIMDAAYPDELSGLAVCETQQSEMSAGATASEVLKNTIADCVIGADEAAVDRALLLLRGTCYTEMNGPVACNGRQDFPLSLRMKSIAKTAPLVVKARIYQLLNEWRVYGTAQLFVEAVEDCAKDPEFKGWSWMARYPAFIENGHLGDLPPGLDYVFNTDRWAEAVTTTKSEVALSFLVHNFAGTASASYEPKLARLLDHKDPEVRARIAFYFAWYRKDMAHAPQEVDSRDPVTGRRTKAYSNLDEVCRYWKQKILGGSG